MNEKEAVELAEKCIAELTKRFVMSQIKFIFKVVDKVRLF